MYLMMNILVIGKDGVVMKCLILILNKQNEILSYSKHLAFCLRPKATLIFINYEITINNLSKMTDADW